MSYKIGIPRSLMYHYYYPGWKEFFKYIDMDIILSPETNKKILDEGVKRAVDDLCLPFKVYFGHIYYLMNKVDYLFVPRFISLGKNNNVCPKFMGLPDMLRASFNNLPPFIEPVVDFRKGLFPLWKIAHEVGSKLNAAYWKVEKAYWKALKKQREFEIIENEGFTPNESMDVQDGKKKKEIIDNKEILKVAVLGHSYIINDNYISMEIIKNLRNMGVKVYTLEMIEKKVIEKYAKYQTKKLFWIYNRQVMGAAYYFLYSTKIIDGIIQVAAFGCGPDSLVKELVTIKGRKNKKISILNLNVDEHSGDAGLLTRLEAFIDLLYRRKMM